MEEIVEVVEESTSELSTGQKFLLVMGVVGTAYFGTKVAYRAARVYGVGAAEIRRRRQARKDRREADAAAGDAQELPQS